MLPLGGPAPALLLPHSMATIIAVSIARGIGFGLATVVLGALVAASVPAERRGEGIGLAGVVACVPAIVALPSGVWLAQNTGYAVVIAITAISALAPLAATPWLAEPGRPAGRQRPWRDRRGHAETETAPAGLLGSLRSGGMLRPGLVFAATTVAAGVVASFLPLAAGVSAGVATLGLFAQAVTATASRWWACRRGDRHGHAGLLIPGLLIAAAGMASLIWVSAPVVVIAGMCLFGIGFGIAQNVTFALMIDRAPALRLRHRQRPVEPGLRRRIRHRPDRVRRVRGAHRVPGGVRPDRAADPRRPGPRGARPPAAGHRPAEDAIPDTSALVRHPPQEEDSCRDPEASAQEGPAGTGRRGPAGRCARRLRAGAAGRPAAAQSHGAAQSHRAARPCGAGLPPTPITSRCSRPR